CAFPDATSGPVISTILHAPHEEPEDQFTLPPEDALSNVASVVNPKYTLSDKLWKYLFDYAAKHKAKGNGFGFGLCGPNDKARTLSARYYKDGSEILIDQGEGRNPRRLTPRECARLMGFDDDNFTMKIPVSDTRAYKQFGNSVVVPVIKEIARQMKPYVLKSLESEGQVIQAKRRSQQSDCMTDIVSPAKRSEMMSGIRGKNTKPEILVRKALHARGFRYRLHGRRLPGKPDIVLPK
ncbi:MAG: DNA cytosine methyltransferase, partial [Pseudomonadales bacterium]